MFLVMVYKPGELHSMHVLKRRKSNYWTSITHKHWILFIVLSFHKYFHAWRLYLHGHSCDMQPYIAIVEILWYLEYIYVLTVSDTVTPSNVTVKSSEAELEKNYRFQSKRRFYQKWASAERNILVISLSLVVCMLSKYRRLSFGSYCRQHCRRRSAAR